MLRYMPSVLTLLRVFFFYHKWILNFVKSFPFVYWDDHMVFVLQFVNVGYHTDFQTLKNPCIPGINPTWSWYVILLMCYWICLLVFCCGFLCLCSSVILACNCLFFWYLCLVLISGWWWPCRMNLEVSLPLQFFERVLEG